MEQRYMEILLEEMRSKFDLVLEGQAALCAEIQADIDKIRDGNNAPRANLAAHRTDTEAHPSYLVRE
jgi:hypothetical protein